MSVFKSLKAKNPCVSRNLGVLHNQVDPQHQKRITTYTTVDTNAPAKVFTQGPGRLRNLM